MIVRNDAGQSEADLASIVAWHAIKKWLLLFFFSRINTQLTLWIEMMILYNIRI